VYLPEFQTTGRALADSGLISGASGNLSIRLKEHLIITKHDSVLSALTSAELIETGIQTDGHATPLASWELPVHRAIYIGMPARAVVHAHPPSAITLSLVEKKLALPGKVAIVGTNAGIVPGVLADEIVCELKKHSLVMVKGHGSFAIGKTLAEACALTIKFEEDCTRLCRQRAIPLQKMSAYEK
jgi:L-fuculose-phosphate aldolase